MAKLTAALGRYARELVVVALLPIAFVICSRLSPYFSDWKHLLDNTSLYMEAGLIALVMTFIIIAGKIDLSVASTLALSACSAALIHAHGVAMPVAIAAGVGVGGLLGLVNGLLIVKLRLPPLTVTIGTFALYRGLAQVLMGDHSVGGFPEWFAGIDYIKVANVPAPLIIFLVLALVAGIVLQKTIIGRWTYSVGANQVTSRYSGVPVGRLVIGLFTASGLISGVAGMMMASRLSVARFDMASGLELDAITAVVLGGTDIFGGRGSVFGTVAALFLIMLLRSGMGLANIQSEKQLVVIGALLILSIGIPNLFRRRALSLAA